MARPSGKINLELFPGNLFDSSSFNGGAHTGRLEARVGFQIGAGPIFSDNFWNFVDSGLFDAANSFSAVIFVTQSDGNCQSKVVPTGNRKPSGAGAR